jgi:hypothetical protein
LGSGLCTHHNDLVFVFLAVFGLRRKQINN